MSAPVSRSRTRSMHSLRSVQHLPVIEESVGAEGDDSSFDTEVPALPEKSPRRSMSQGNFAAVHYQYHGCPPPAYSVSTPPGTARIDGLVPLKKSRKPNWLIGRGGWWRLSVIALAVIVCVLGLILGLVLGLQVTNSSNGSPSTKNVTQMLQFPAGSYAFTTALTNISTSCTSNANTFRCYPYTTYNTSGNGAAAAFFWTITQIASSPTAEYNISSAPNPFVPQFRNISTTILDRDTDAERLAFSFSMDLAITPAAALDSSNTAATCWFNSTMMNATIWTRRRAEFPGNMSSSVSATNPSSNFDMWPFAVEIEQSVSAGSGVPSCVDSGDQSLGDFALERGVGSCGCLYRNFGLGS